MFIIRQLVLGNAKMISYLYRINRSLRFSRSFCSGNLRVLGIESSCDDTSAAVIDSSKTILGEGHYSQYRIHSELGGILPHVATELHQEHIGKIVESSLNQSSLDIKDLNAIAVTVKPGLILSLEAGVEFAKKLCKLHRKPLIPIHHMKAHALTGRLVDEVEFPFLTLLISGGHCLLALATSADKFYILGETQDSGPGLVLDKFARKARLKNERKFSGLVGGKAVQEAASKGDPRRFPFKVMLSKNCTFSFSGIFTRGVTLLLEFEKEHNLNPDEVIPEIYDLCASFQWAIAKHLCRRMEIAMSYVEQKKLLGNEKCVVVSGGVASNHFIRNTLRYVCDARGYKMVVPPPKLCTDNGAMIAWNGIECLRENLPLVQPEDLDSVTFMAKCPIGENISEDVEGVINCGTSTLIKQSAILEAQLNSSVKRQEEIVT